MNNINRRSFLTKSSIGIAAFAVGGTNELFAAAKANAISVGFQTWVVREMLNKDLPGTLKTMAAMGYKQTEMCYPRTYVNAGFAALAAMKTADVKSAIIDAGLACKSCHFGLADFTDNEKQDAAIQYAKEMGLDQMICSSFGLPKTATLNDYLEAAGKLNKGAEKVKAAGMQAGFHNHSMEFAVLDGQLIYDALMKQFDPKLVKMQFQTEVINLGYKAADHFKKYPGRFISSHLSDWTADKKQVPIGKGVIDWKEFFVAAKTGGVKNYFVEMDFDTLDASAKFLLAMK